jgi:acylphosphatase
MTKRAVVTGAVQGVFFRDSVRRRAVSRGVTGWVRNRPDGAVEAVFEGRPEAVEEMLDLVRRGPPRARVEAVEVTDEPPGGYSGFQVL